MFNKSVKSSKSIVPKTLTAGIHSFSFTVPGNYLFPVPLGVSSILAELFGGGGGGAGSTLLGSSPEFFVPGGGGGSGASIKATIPIPIQSSHKEEDKDKKDSKENKTLPFLHLVVGAGGSAAPVTITIDDETIVAMSGANGSASTITGPTLFGSTFLLSAGGGFGAPVPIVGTAGNNVSAGGTGGVALFSGLAPATFETVNGQTGASGLISNLVGGNGGSASLGGGAGGFGAVGGNGIRVPDISTFSAAAGIQPGGGGGGASVFLSNIGEAHTTFGFAGAGAPGTIRLTMTVVQ